MPPWQQLSCFLSLLIKVENVQIDHNVRIASSAASDRSDSSSAAEFRLGRTTALFTTSYVFLDCPSFLSVHFLYICSTWETVISDYKGVTLKRKSTWRCKNVEKLIKERKVKVRGSPSVHGSVKESHCSDESGTVRFSQDFSGLESVKFFPLCIKSN